MSNKEIAEAISKHHFKSAYEHFADEIRWNLIGGEVVHGKEEVKKTCEVSAKYLANVQTTFTAFKTYEAGDTIIIESSAEYIDEKQEKSVVASCDLYTFEDRKLRIITSYNIEIPQS